MSRATTFTQSEIHGPLFISMHFLTAASFLTQLQRSGFQCRESTWTKRIDIYTVHGEIFLLRLWILSSAVDFPFVIAVTPLLYYRIMIIGLLMLLLIFLPFVLVASVTWLMELYNSHSFSISLFLLGKKPKETYEPIPLPSNCCIMSNVSPLSNFKLD